MQVIKFPYCFHTSPSTRSELTPFGIALAETTTTASSETLLVLGPHLHHPGNATGGVGATVSVDHHHHLRGGAGHNLSDGMATSVEIGLNVAAIFTIIRILLAIVGVVANMITAVVLTNRRLWSPTSMLLLSLVAYDAVFLLASIPISVTGLFIKRDPMTFTTILGVFYPLRYMAHMGSIYTTVTVTVERFLVVLVPLKARIFCTFGKTRKILLGVFAFSVAFNIPRCFFQPLFRATLPMNMTISCGNASTPCGQWSPQLTTPSNTADPPTTGAVPNDQSAYYFWLYFRVYELYMSGVLFYLLPYALIPILNLQLLLAIKKRRSETRMMQVKNEHQPNYPRSTDLEDGVTMIVLGITACFFICCLIPAIYTMTQVAEMPDTNVFASFLIIASDTMLCINASTDFFFYCLLGRKFRNIFIRLFCPKRYIQKSRTMTSLNHSYYRHNRANSETCYHSV